jgi:hypothetical protein
MSTSAQVQKHIVNNTQSSRRACSFKTGYRWVLFSAPDMDKGGKTACEA